MGNDHSRPAEAEGAGDRPPDYYELLQISEDATDGEIKVRESGGVFCVSGQLINQAILS